MTSGGRRVPVVTFLLCLCSSQLHGPIDSHQTCLPEIPVGHHHLRGKSLNSFSPLAAKTSTESCQAAGFLLTDDFLLSLDSLAAGHLSQNTRLPPSYHGVLHHDAGEDLPLSSGVFISCSLLSSVLTKWTMWPFIFLFCLLQIVSWGNDQVALSSKFETREDVGS